MNERAPRKPWFGLAQGASKIFADTPALLFGGCTAVRLRPSWMKKAEKTLTGLGARLIEATGLVCCGGTYKHAGMCQSAAEAAQTNLNYWRSLGRPKVITICASCLRSLRHYPDMPGLLNTAEAKIWMEALTPLSDCLQKAETALTPHVPESYSYHSPCHWGGKDADMLWLEKALPGLRKGKTLCCGFGGVFKLMNPLLSRSMAEKCWKGFGPTVNTVLTGCSGCSMQLAAHAPQNAETLHWLDIWCA
jgi:glycolate oxidase iron-sulfur subunit